MAKSEFVRANEKIAEKVVGGYKKIEDAVVGGYKKIEETVVGGYEKIEDAFIEHFLLQGDETAEAAQERLRAQREKQREELLRKAEAAGRRTA